MEVEEEEAVVVVAVGVMVAVAARLTVADHRVGVVHHRVVQLALARRHLAPLVGGVHHVELFDVLLRDLQRRVER